MPDIQTPEHETPDTNAVQPDSDGEQPNPEQDAFKREVLESSVEEQLARVFADDDETAEPEVEESAEEPADDTPDDEPAEEPDEEPAEDDAGEEDEDAEPAEEAAAEEEETHDDPTDAPTLPDAYRRSLKAYGWEDDEIDQNLRVLGDSFVKTAERIHDNRNAEVQKWADAGRKVRQEQEPSEQPDASTAQSSQQPQQTQGQAPQKLPAVDVDKLKKEYGEDELVDAIAGPVNAAIDQINTILPQLQQGQQYAEQARLDKVAQEVESFFGDESLKPYAEVYGAPGQMNEQQEQARNKVLDVAYDLMLGSESLRGERLPIRDALDYAHHIVAKDHTAAATRKSLKKEAKARNRGITQKPSAKSSAPAVRARKSGPPETRDELEARTRDRLAKAFQS